MPDNVVQTLQHLLQDVIAPDVRELKVRVTSLEKSVDERFKGIDERFTSLERESEAQFKAIMAAISESPAQGDVVMLREMASLRERVAVLESAQSR